MSVRVMFVCVHQGGRSTAAMTMPRNTNGGGDSVPAAELELLAQETEARGSGSLVSASYLAHD
jgi:hypothetical protein